MTKRNASSPLLPLIKTLTLSALLLGLAQAQPAHAQETLVVDVAVDLPIMLGAGAVFTGLYLGDDMQVPGALHTEHIPGGIDSIVPLRLREDFASYSDVGLYGSLAFGLGLALQQGVKQEAVGTHLLLVCQAAFINGALTEVTKYAVDRPRPYTYTEPTGEADDTLSFFSGHASFTAVATMYSARSLDITHDFKRGQRVALYGGAALVSSSVAALRVGAGKHFVSDVTVGLLVGGAVGWLVPELHRSGRHQLGEVQGGLNPEISGISVAWVQGEDKSGDGELKGDAQGGQRTPVISLSGRF